MQGPELDVGSATETGVRRVGNFGAGSGSDSGSLELQQHEGPRHADLHLQ
jgi:hypothetical protein